MNFKNIALALAIMTIGTAQASIIKLEAAAGSTPFLGSAVAYRDAVNQALTGATYQAASAATYNGLTHNQYFNNTGSWAMKSTLNFGVASAATFDFRVGVDFGMGGAMFLDGVAVDFRSNDMWWGSDFNNAAGVFSTKAALGAGNHVLTVYGFEACCDGGQNAQFRVQGQQWTSFGANDGLRLVEVPEPASLGIMLTGAALLGLSRRRKAAPQA